MVYHSEQAANKIRRRDKVSVCKFLFLIFLVSLSRTGFTQDIHFSQFFNCPLNLSPANTGNFNGDWRAGINYKRQWSIIDKAYNTLAAYYDQPVYYKNHRFSAGGFFVNDRTNLAYLNATKFYLSGAYHREYKRHFFHGGLQVGYVLNSADKSNLTFDEQYRRISGNFDSNLDPGESLDYNPSYLDINLGFGWSKEFSNFTPRVGYGIYHLNAPRKAFVSEDSRLHARHALFLSGDISLLPSTYFTPNVLYMTSAKATDAYFGTNFTYVFFDKVLEKSVYTGVYFKNEFKNFDAMVITVGGRYDEWQVGLSYDINVSPLRVATRYRGGVEISVIYRSLNTKAKNFTIPCERF